MANVNAALKDWSSTSSSNQPDGTDVPTVDDDLREVQGGVVRGLSHKGADIASATTTDLGAVEGLMHDITGATTITGFGTVRAGIWKMLKFEGALTLTHNATSLILLTGANRTTVAGDVGLYMSEASGNWREMSYMPINTQLTNSGVKFAATQAASSDVNTLDDYEEGTWTPSVGGNATYTTQTGTYTKIGRLVHVWMDLTINSIGTGSVTTVSGLPFTSATVGASLAVGLFTSIVTNVTMLQGLISAGGTSIAFTGLTAAGDSSTTQNVFQNATRIVCGGAYHV